MTSSPAKIREQLLKSIDKDAKVVDTEEVLKAISTLEKMTLTKEALEGTRLGRLVNNIRKAATDEKLRSRCKRLIQKWQNQFVQKGASQQSSKSSPPASKPPAKTGGTPVDQTKSENRKRRKPESPSTPPEDKHPPKKQTIRKEDSDPKDSSSSKINVSPKAGKTRSSIGKTPDGGKETKSLHKQVLKLNANKAAGVVDSSQPEKKMKTAKSGKSLKVAKHISKGNGSTNSSPSASMEEAEINVASDAELPYRETANNPDFIHDEQDVALNRTGGDASLFDMEESLEGSIDELTMSSVPDSPLESLPSQGSNSSQHSYQCSKMSELDEKLECTVETPEVSQRDVKEEDVERLHQTQWEGMNGNYNSRGEWSSWYDCVELNSGGGNTLHVLPYVCID